MIKRLTRPILPILAITLSGAAPPAPGPQLAEAVKFRQQVIQAFDRLQPCGRSAPGLKLAVMAALWQVDDSIKLQFGEAAAKTAENAAKLPYPACDTPQDQQIKLFTHRLGFEWLSRQSFARAASLKAGWSYSLAELPSFPPELEALRVQLGTNLASVHGVPAVDGMARQIGQETETDLALMCEARKTIRAKTPRACPALPAGLAQHRPTAALRLANVELMAARIAQSEGAGKPMPNPLGEPFGYYDSSNFQLWTARMSVPCARQQSVVYLTDPAAIRTGGNSTLPIRAFAAGDIVGKVVVQPDNPAYATRLKIISGGVTGQSAFPGEREFYRCPNQLPK